MALRKTTSIVYALLGVVYILLGFAAILAPAGLLPQGLIDSFLGDETITPLMGHFLQEFGSVFVALGVIFIWYASRREPSPGFHWAVTFYFFINASIHWVGPSGFTDSWQSGTFNTIPFALMLVLGILQRRAI